MNFGRKDFVRIWEFKKEFLFVETYAINIKQMAYYCIICLYELV